MDTILSPGRKRLADLLAESPLATAHYALMEDHERAEFDGWLDLVPEPVEPKDLPHPVGFHYQAHRTWLREVERDLDAVQRVGEILQQAQYGEFCWLKGKLPSAPTTWICHGPLVEILAREKARLGAIGVLYLATLSGLNVYDEC